MTQANGYHVAVVDATGAEELNAKPISQSHLPILIDLIINGYHCSGDTWRVDVFEH